MYSPATILSTKRLGRTGRPDPTNTCLEGLRERTCSSISLAQASVSPADWDPAGGLKVGRAVEVLPSGGEPSDAPVDSKI